MSKIFIIDDDLSHHRLTEVLIKKYGIFENFISYTNPERAMVDLIEASKRSEGLPDAILLDLNMPGFNGWQFLERFVKVEEAAQKEVPVYIVTSSIDPNDSFRSQEYAVVKGFFSKPISPETLKKIASMNTSTTSSEG
ncbi:two-component system response regulator [Pedobacter sp. SYSU D00535]|uniref:response regulator n=1 Tax=Pedobacter sp. SYSU D00535 TaxID=2810308 RepID=UPI001A96BF81|nr:response regulator [Pedobacter sp. SYSU D00535]